MFISHGVWLLRTRGLRRRAKDAGLAFDELPEAIAWQEGGLKLPSIDWRTLASRIFLRSRKISPQGVIDRATVEQQMQQPKSLDAVV